MAFKYTVDFNSREVLNFLYQMFVGDYFTDDKIYEGAPTKLSGEGNYFVAFSLGNVTNDGVNKHLDVMAELYVQFEADNPDYKLMEKSEPEFNACINKGVNREVLDYYGELYTKYNVTPTQLRLYSTENSYSIVRQHIRVLLNE